MTLYWIIGTQEILRPYGFDPRLIYSRFDSQACDTAGLRCSLIIREKLEYLLPTLFMELLNPHLDDALHYCRALCASWSPEEAEDVLQEALLKAYRSRDSLRNQEAFRSWFFQIITRCFQTQVRRSRWHWLISLPEEKTVESIPPIYRERQDLDMEVRQALAQLKIKERTALLLYELGGFSVPEIAEIQNDKSSSAVKSRLSRARLKVRKWLDPATVAQEKPGRTQSQTVIGDLHYETLQLVEDINGE